MKTLTTATGTPIADNQNSLTAGKRGPTLLQDTWLLEKLAHFDRERIPERVVHAKGSAAYGELTITNDIAQYSKAESLFAIFHRGRGARGCRRGTRCARLCAQTLHTRGQLGYRGQQHAGIFHQRRGEVPRFYPFPKARSQDKLTKQHGCMGFLELTPRIFAPSNNPYE